MKHQGFVWAAVLVLLGCASTGNGGTAGGLDDDHTPQKAEGYNPTKGPIGGGEGGAGQGGGVGQGGGGGCLSACQALAAECGQDPAGCSIACAQFPNAGPCLSQATCDTAEQCFTGGVGGMGGSGFGGMGGSGFGGMGGSGFGGMGGSGFGGMGGSGFGGMGGGGSCTYPDCGTCATPCEACVCAFQGDPTNCDAYCN